MHLAAYTSFAALLLASLGAALPTIGGMYAYAVWALSPTYSLRIKVPLTVLALIK